MTFGEKLYFFVQPIQTLDELLLDFMRIHCMYKKLVFLIFVRGIHRVLPMQHSANM
jgi:hypothetical protein